MKLNLLTYADELFRPMQAKLVEHAQSLMCFDHIYSRNRANLIETDFYSENKYILDKPKGGGYCLWKPYFILQTLSRMNEGDVLVYMDSADWINQGFRDELLRYMVGRHLILTAGAFTHKDWTKRDTFVSMLCDTEQYHNAIQLEAGICVFKNTEYSRKILNEWLKWCTVSAVITEDENICNLPNLDGFREHRYDQSVLTNIAIKNEIQPSDFMRKFITCNVNMPG